MVWALNFQLKSARFLSSRNLASRIRRSIARWRLRAAGSPRISSRKFRCDSPSCSARASAASSVWSESGNFSVFASSRTRSRRFVPWSVLFLVAVRFFLGVVMGVGLLKQQVLIFRGGSRRCGVVAEQFPEVGWLVFRHAVPTGLRPGLHGQDAFHRLPRERSVADGPLQSGQEVLPAIGAQQGQHLLGLVPATALRAQETLQEPHAHGAQLGEPFAVTRAGSAGGWR